MSSAAAMEAIDELVQLSESMRQAASLLADDDPSDETASRRPSTFLNAVALGNVGSGKSAVLNSLIGHPVLPTGENGATRAPIVVDLARDPGLSSKSIVLQIDSKSQQVSASALRHSLQDRLSKGASSGSGRGRSDEIYLKLRTSTAPPLKLIDLPGIDQRVMDDSTISEYAGHNDAILIVVIPAMQAADVASSRALNLAKDIDPDGTRTIGVLSKIDQAAADAKTVSCVQAILSNKGAPRAAADIEWVALIGQSVSIASAQSGSVGSDNSLETAWRAEAETLKSILTGAPQSKLGRIALVDTIAKQISKRMKVRLPNMLSGYASYADHPVFLLLNLIMIELHTHCCNRLQGKSQIVQDELARLGESMVQSAEGTRAVALELCREFEDKFLAHITSGEGSGWKIVASFEGKFPDRIKQLPLDRHFDLNNVKRIVLEADGYQPYLISPEKGLKSLIKGVLEMAKEPSRLCVEEVHRVLLDIVNAAANATPGLGRYPPFKREVIAIASNALDAFKSDAKKMVVALVDMERAFVPPQHFIRLVQRRSITLRIACLFYSILIRAILLFHILDLFSASSPQTGSDEAGGNLKSMKDKSNQQDKDTKEGPNLQVAGPGGEITAGYLLKKSAKNNEWSRRWFVLNEKSGKLGYTKKQEERHFRGVIVLEECNLEEIEEEEISKSSKDSKKANGKEKGPSLVFKITNRVAYKTVLKAHSAVILKAESMADKIEWIKKIKGVIQSKGGSVKGPNTPEDGSMRQSRSDGSLDTMARRPADPEEELRWMSQEVRGYVEAVLNSLAANVPKAIVLCQVEKSKEDMLNQLYSSIRFGTQFNILYSKYKIKTQEPNLERTNLLAESSPRSPGHSGEDWKSAFGSTANGSVDRSSSQHETRSRSADSRGRRYENGDANSGSRRTPNRLPPAPPSGGRY
ncbi:Dynamin-2B [Dichanthelium oligosanthes]|uniref:dynamin GTPase n=1 Tax=Dichanthelium oligosanthes TaxID=888268 RepID=A0A1E5VFD8_9POAL|nr:Dynamin-2B [Dichanthelium oligosanthes]